MRNRSSLMAAAILLAVPFICRAQDAVSPIRAEAQSEGIVVSATRIETPEEESPATVDIIRSDDFEIKQTHRVADALREVPGVSVVQSGAPGPLTSVFTRGRRSQPRPVLLLGIPVPQGLQR